MNVKTNYVRAYHIKVKMLESYLDFVCLFMS